jgi:threonine/homoserine/homoserine lactone efflux protein
MEIFISLFVIWPLLVLTPGPAFLLMVRNTLTYGLKPGLCTGFGITVAISIYVFITLFGIYTLSKNETLYHAVKYAGSIYLISLGLLGIIRRKKVLMYFNAAINPKKSRFFFGRAFNEGFLSTLLNPIIPILMLGIFTQLIPASSPTSLKVICLIEVIAINILVCSLLCKLLGYPTIKRKLNSFRTQINIISNLILIGLGTYALIEFFLAFYLHSAP